MSEQQRPTCGCSVAHDPNPAGLPYVVHCPLHKAAEGLLAACKSVVEQDGFCGSGIMRKRIDEMKAAIASAERRPL